MSMGKDGVVDAVSEVIQLKKQKLLDSTIFGKTLAALAGKYVLQGKFNNFPDDQLYLKLPKELVDTAVSKKPTVFFSQLKSLRDGHDDALSRDNISEASAYLLFIEYTVRAMAVASYMLDGYVEEIMGTEMFQRLVLVTQTIQAETAGFEQDMKTVSGV